MFSCFPSPATKFSFIVAAFLHKSCAQIEIFNSFPEGIHTHTEVVPHIGPWPILHSLINLLLLDCCSIHCKQLTFLVNRPWNSLLNHYQNSSHLVACENRMLLFLLEFRTGLWCWILTSIHAGRSWHCISISHTHLYNMVLCHSDNSSTHTHTHTHTHTSLLILEVSFVMNMSEKLCNMS